MARQRFRDWMDDIDSICRNELGSSLQDLPEYDRQMLRSDWENGFSPRQHVNEQLKFGRNHENRIPVLGEDDDEG